MLKSNSLKDSKEGNYFIEGQLTIKGYSNAVSFPILMEIKGEQLFATASVPLNRSLWELKEPLNEEGNLIYNMDGMVNLDINIEANLVK